jgi:hypothetical protein
MAQYAFAGPFAEATAHKYLAMIKSALYPI